jgi:stress-induced morphogen
MIRSSGSQPPRGGNFSDALTALLWIRDGDAGYYAWLSVRASFDGERNDIFQVMDPKEIETMIARGIPDAQVEVRDYTGGGDHFEALVVSPSFEGKGLIERHQLVYQALGDAMRVQVHALTLKTLTPAQYQNRR